MSLPGTRKKSSRSLLVGLVLLGGAVAAGLVAGGDVKRYVRMRTM